MDFESENLNSLPSCFKGFAVGMQNPDHMNENMKVIGLPDIQDPEIKGKYLSPKVLLKDRDRHVRAQYMKS